MGAPGRGGEAAVAGDDVGNSLCYKGVRGRRENSVDSAGVVKYHVTEVFADDDGRVHAVYNLRGEDGTLCG